MTNMANGSSDGKHWNSITKGVFDFVLITLLTTSLFYTVITSRDDDKLWEEIVPIIIGTILYPATLYLFELIQSMVRNIKDNILLKRRQVGGIHHIDTALLRSDEKQPKKRKAVSKSMMETAKKNMVSWLGYMKLSLTFMMHNSCLTIILWDSFKLILWVVTITYWRRDSNTDDWNFSLVPVNIYRLHFIALSLTNTELCLFILGSTEIRDVLGSLTFWVSLFTLPPVAIIAKYLFCSPFSFFNIYWMLGFMIWIKCFLIMDRIINIFNFGIERKSHRLWRIGFGIFLVASAFASSMYVLQGIHPFKEETNQFVYSLARFGEFFYFSFITFSTVGYGDVTPKTINAKLMSIVFISLMLVWVPYEMNSLIQAFGGVTRISGHISSWGSMDDFIIVIGDIDPIQLSSFIFKIYYAGAKMKIILLTNKSIEKYDLQVDQAKLLRQSLCIIKEDVGLNGYIDILHTVKINRASATYVLSTFKTKDTRKTDMKTVAKLISLKKFGYTGENLLIQFCSPIGPQITLPGFGHIVNLYRTKMVIIAKHITCPGIITLIINLSLTHNAMMPKDTNEQHSQKLPHLYKNYLVGVSKCLRIYEIPERLVGVAFETLCSNLYNRHGSITIGIMHSSGLNRVFQLNPAGKDYIIKKGDRAILIADSAYTKSMQQDIVSAAGTNSSYAMRDTIFNLVRNKWSEEEDDGEATTGGKSDNDDDHADRSSSIHSNQDGNSLIPVDLGELDSKPDVNCMVVSSITFACRYVYEHSSLPVIAIIGYSDFILQLLVYFEEIKKFNVVLFEREISSKLPLNILLRFKNFLAVIDGDPMKKSDVNRAELQKACYIYVLPSPILGDPEESEEDQDIRTILIYRHIKSIMQGTMVSKLSNEGNIFSLVELHNAANVTYLDDRKWAAWNVFDKRLDPSFSYIHSFEYSMGQFISDEMLYGLTINTMTEEDYTIYRILLGLVSTGDANDKNTGIEMMAIRDIEGFNKRTFGQLFDHLFSKMNKIVIGIYRVGVVPMESCVICAPPSNFLISHIDMAYIISNNNEICKL